MKNVTTKLMFAAAALVAVAGAASAQTMEAKIPFAFRAGDKVLAAGTYQIQMREQASGNRLIVFANTSGAYQTLAVGLPNGDPKRAWVSAGDPVLEFQCGVGRCALGEIWNGNTGAPAYRVAVPRLGKDEPSHTAAIAMVRVKGE